MEHIVFLDRASIPVEVRRPDIAHTWDEFDQSGADDVITRLSAATIAISNKVPLRAATLAQNPGLKMIAAAATGTDHIDLDYCKKQGIAVANVRGYAEHSVPEHVFTLALALRRNLLAAPTSALACGINPRSFACLATRSAICTAVRLGLSVSALWAAPSSV